MKIILTVVLAGQSLVQFTTAASTAVKTNSLEERQLVVDGEDVTLEMPPGLVLPPPDMPSIVQSSTTGTSTMTGPSSATDQTEPAPEKTTETHQEVKTGSLESTVSPTSTPTPTPTQPQSSPSPATESKPVGNVVTTTAALPHGQLLTEALQELIDGIDTEKARERHDLPALVPSKDTAKVTQPSATTLETVATPSSSA
ncbi:hypothetical protein KC318_g9994 [Hortaea werneckii]|nr:hypothetical protein KC334_g10193 [Hortaea werneckii]KAI6994218.1 hypothetical protein KC355_g10277 [Hortaea werneckii]KAI7204114.1 hypothetical protein KC324_g934 [Hortaea werneckii]KAI7594863.1 hypothetical protein KC316_g891 [Hortaea werneckii]KAI7660581.1 hypothetical protein KC318_g9994 [Hortaea werneckii]